MSDSATEPLPQIEPGDFYLNDDGWMVFTRAYHLKRGFCCKSGCLHCPWNYRKKRETPAASTTVPADDEGAERDA